MGPKPLCGFVAATNIENIYPEWECDIYGNYVTEPCGDPRWTGVICTYETDIIYELTLFDIQINGTLPSSIGDLTDLYMLSIFHSSLSSSIPEEICKLTKLNTLQLSGGDLTGSLPLNIGAMSGLNILSIDNNFLSHSLPRSLENINSLSYLILNDNHITGQIPSVFQSKLINIILENNRLIGTIPESVIDMTSGVYFKVNDNDIEGTIPTGFGNISGLKILKLQNTHMSGNIPSELCNHDIDMSVDVTNTRIDCFSGCLTSSQVIINGADSTCPDGSQMERFLLCLSCGFLFCVLCTLYHHYIHKLVVQIKNIMEGNRKNYSVIMISFVKFWLVVIAVLYVNDYWTYCAKNNNEVVESCTSSQLSSCRSFCGSTSTFELHTNDDIGFAHYSSGGYCTASFEGSCACVYWQVFQLVPLLLHLLQFIMQCICIFGYSIFDPQQAHYNMIARYVLQQRQYQPDGLMYNSLLEQSDADNDMKTDESTAMDVAVNAGVDASPPGECVGQDAPNHGSEAMGCDSILSESSESDASTPSRSYANFKSSPSYRMSGAVIEFSTLVKQLLSQPWYGVFAFVEMGTFLYVWMELFYSPVHCGGGIHISQLYYPIIMTLLDMGKLNAYMSIQFVKQGLYLDAVVICFNFYVFALYGYLTMLLAVSYFRTVLLFLYDGIMDVLYASAPDSDTVVHMDGKSLSDQI